MVITRVTKWFSSLLKMKKGVCKVRNKTPFLLTVLGKISSYFSSFGGVCESVIVFVIKYMILI